MDFSNKPVWVILGVPLLALAAYGLGIVGESDQQKFDRLQIGMSAQEVEKIIYPPRSGKYARFRDEVRDNENLTLNGHMSLTIRDGVLVEKEWTGTDAAKKSVGRKK